MQFTEHAAIILALENTAGSYAKHVWSYNRGRILRNRMKQSSQSKRKGHQRFILDKYIHS